jgi:hypothetical protein
MNEEDIYLKEGWSVFIDDPYNAYYRIVRREPFDFVTGEESPAIFSTVASGSESGFKNISTLEPDNDPLHLFQVVWGVADVGDIQYYLKLPAGQNRFGVDVNKEIGFLNADKSPFYEPNPVFQFFLVHDWIPAVNCKNGSPVTITPKVWFRGMKYDILKLGDANMPNPPPIVKKIVFGGIKNTP